MTKIETLRYACNYISALAASVKLLDHGQGGGELPNPQDYQFMLSHEFASAETLIQQQEQLLQQHGSLMPQHSPSSVFQRQRCLSGNEADLSFPEQHQRDHLLLQQTGSLGLNLRQQHQDGGALQQNQLKMNPDNASLLGNVLSHQFQNKQSNVHHVRHSQQLQQMLSDNRPPPAMQHPQQQQQQNSHGQSQSCDSVSHFLNMLTSQSQHSLSGHVLGSHTSHMTAHITPTSHTSHTLANSHNTPTSNMNSVFDMHNNLNSFQSGHSFSTPPTSPCDVIDNGNSFKSEPHHLTPSHCQQSNIQTHQLIHQQQQHHQHQRAPTKSVKTEPKSFIDTFSDHAHQHTNSNVTHNLSTSLHRLLAPNHFL